MTEESVRQYRSVEFENQLLRASIIIDGDACVAELFYKPLKLSIIPAEADSFWCSRLFLNANDKGPARELLSAHASRKFEISSVQTDENGSELTVEFEQASALRLTRTFSLIRNEPVLRVEEIVTNLSDKPIEALLGFRTVFQAPFLCAGATIHADATGYFDPREDPIVRMRWPSAGDDDFSKFRGSGERTAFVTDFGSGKLRVENTGSKLAAELKWDAEKFPYCWLVENEKSLILAPFSGLPSALEEGHGTISIEPGASVAASFEARLITL